MVIKIALRVIVLNITRNTFKKRDGGNNAEKSVSQLLTFFDRSKSLRGAKTFRPRKTVKLLISNICIIQGNCKAYSLGRNRSWKVDGSNGKFGTGISVTERDRNSEQRAPR